jgi:hypothetical protein
MEEISVTYVTIALVAAGLAAGFVIGVIVSAPAERHCIESCNAFIIKHYLNDSANCFAASMAYMENTHAKEGDLIEWNFSQG